MPIETLTPPETQDQPSWSPADTISSVSFAASAAGAVMLDRPAGVILYGLGRVGDLVDGLVARRTYSSKRGPKLDATLDKIAVGAGLGATAYYDAMPRAVIAVIAVHNIVNAVSNVRLDRMGLPAETVLSGKYGMFGHNLSFGAFVLGNAVGSPDLTAVGWGLFAATEPFATEASIEYSKKAVNAQRAAKAHQRQRR